MKKRWNQTEENKLIELLKKGFNYDDISEKLDRTSRSIKEKTHKLGYKYLDFKKEISIMCLNCDKEIKISKQNKREINRKFCSKSCSASYNNKKRTKKIKNKISTTLKTQNYNKKNNIEKTPLPKCLNCDNNVKNVHNKCCSNKCVTEYSYNQYIKKWINGEIDGNSNSNKVSNTIKTYLFEKYDNKCSKCGWCEINPHTGRIPLEVEHIDGNHKNNKEENLTLLCPNCHSLTATYKGVNKGNGRHSRMKRYYEGKSY